MKRSGIALVLLCASCSAFETSLQRAERHYNYLKANNGRPAELCEVSKEGQSAAIDASADEVTLITWRSRVSLHCEYGRQ